MIFTFEYDNLISRRPIFVEFLKKKDMALSHFFIHYVIKPYPQSGFNPIMEGWEKYGFVAPARPFRRLSISGKTVCDLPGWETFNFRPGDGI